VNTIGVPLGFMLTPFIPCVNRSQIEYDVIPVSIRRDIPRCHACHGYVNPFCEVSSLRWICSLCGENNIIKRSQDRYRNSSSNFLPELHSILIDYPKSFNTSNKLEM
jgi:hypothetical protein